MIKMVSHRSPDPWILQYSIPYLAVLVFTIPTVIVIVFLFYRFEFKAFNILLKNCSALLVILFVIELYGQIYATFRPGYHVLWMYPDETLGWKYPPDHEFTYTAGNWYAREFSEISKINSAGFRDLERPVEKSPDVIRISILGPSVLAGLETPFDQSITRQLENKLNQSLGPRLKKRFEVFNWGVAGYGFNQYFHTYSTYSRQYKSDYVISFAFDITQIWRTIEGLNCWSVQKLIRRNSKHAQKYNKVCMDIRPRGSFTLESVNRLSKIFFLSDFHEFIKEINLRKMKKMSPFPFSWEEYLEFSRRMGDSIEEETIRTLAEQLKKENLTHSKPKDYAKFKMIRDDIIENGNNGKFAVKNPRESYLFFFFDNLVKRLSKIQTPSRQIREEAKGLIRTYLPKNIMRPIKGNENYVSVELGLFIALKFLQMVQDQVQKDGARFLIADGTHRIWAKDSRLPVEIYSSVLEKFSAVGNAGYLDVGECLNRASEQGIKTSWNHDPHFTAAGNKVVADCLYDWFRPQLQSQI